MDSLSVEVEGPRMNRTNRHVAIVGAGSLGLFTAYELNKRGVQVTVFDQNPADNLRNASWGNAGHIVPVMSVPLASYSNIKASMASVFQQNSFMRIPRRIDLKTLTFLMRFASKSSHRHWLNGLANLYRINRLAFDAFEDLQTQGIDVGFEYAPFVSSCTTQAAATTQLKDHIAAAQLGMDLEIELLSPEELHALEPLTIPTGKFGLELQNQGIVKPPQLLHNLVKTLTESGVQFLTAKVEAVEPTPSGDVLVKTTGRTPQVFHKAVLANGGWLSELARAHGVQVPVLSGFGYSLQVDVPSLPRGMLYFPEAKIATTRLGESLRVSSLLQIDAPNAKFDRRSQELLERNARQMLPTANWETQRELWHGGRPLSSDGLPLIGETRTKNVYVNGGHGMWGITLGPISGKLLAEAIVNERAEIDMPGFSARRKP